MLCRCMTCLDTDVQSMDDVIVHLLDRFAWNIGYIYIGFDDP